MKIIILGSAYPLRGGLAAYNERLAREFLHQGHSVQVFTFSLQYPSFLFPGATQYSDQPPPADLFIQVKVNSINPLNWLRIGKEIASLKPDILLIKFWLPFMGPCLGTIARIAKRNQVTKVISILDNVVPHEKRIGDRILSKYFINSVDAFVAMSQSVLNDLKQFDEIKPRTLCPHPLYDNFGEAVSKTEAYQKLGLEINCEYILFFGFIRDYKGLDLLLKAMADERIRNMNIKLLVAGEFYTDSRPYLDLIAQLQIAGQVILKTDFIPDDMVRYYFCAADLVVQPYKHATQSGVTQICYHFNRPMLVTNVGGLPEMVPHKKAGYVVEPNEKAVADAIIDFYTNHREFIMRDFIKTEKKKYSWNNLTGKIVELYHILKSSELSSKK
ncbi:MAG: glycosyltransferase [Chitinophagales bacterium]|nr:glycosyltransferase [Chitinophagales bacterium]MDW8273237.1 glycosyltransferase [Chitinophagales bacterium]